MNVEVIQQAAQQFPKPDRPTPFTYGTAGFRMKHDILDSIMCRTGMLAALRSKSLNGRVIGVMMTASHNPEADNGVKLVDPLGEMLKQEWEHDATLLANANNEDVVACLQEIIARHQIDMNQPAHVVIARDTRPSGVRLTAALKAGILALGANLTDYEEMTTPQLHYVVRCLNTKDTPDAYGLPTETAYYEKLAVAFQKLVTGLPSSGPLVIDCANGIGAPKMEQLMKHIGEQHLKATLVNTDIRKEGVLNHQCGADFVKVEQKPPHGVSEAQLKGRCASLDGDADRVVYYFVDQNDKFQLLDGDKIAALAAGFIKKLIDRIPPLKGKIEIGVVQTAYANGSSTRYYNRECVPVACTETGVKHLHHKAEEFGVGVYFEANGHGTVLFHPETIKSVNAVNAIQLTEDAQKALATLKAMISVINQAVGDAISDLLMVEAILTHLQWSPKSWATELYTDLPSRQLKVKVKNRAAFKTTDADRQLVEPEGLQAVIDQWVAKFEFGRSFVRPSGTEDVVRVYAEAKTQEECDSLAYGIAGEVYDRAGGVGERPTKP